jgi:hypothetical protein
MVDVWPAFGDPLLIRYRGTYDYDGLLAKIRKYFAEYDLKIDEPKFKFKQAGAGGAEADFRVKGWRLVSHYIKINLQIDGHAWDVKRKTIEKNGEKKVVTDGKIQMTIVCTASFDYANAFDSNKKKNAEKFLIDWMKKQLDDEWVGMQFGENYVNGLVFIRQLVLNLDSVIKEHLNMECV